MRRKIYGTISEMQYFAGIFSWIYKVHILRAAMFYNDTIYIEVNIMDQIKPPNLIFNHSALAQFEQIAKNVPK